MYLRGLIPGSIVFMFHCVPDRDSNKVIGIFNDWELECAFARNIIRASDPLTVCPSQFFWHWAQTFGADPARCQIVMNSVNLSDFECYPTEDERQAWRRDNNIPAGAHVFVTPARMLKKKGIMDLVMAAPRFDRGAFVIVASSSHNCDLAFKTAVDDALRATGVDNLRIVYDEYDVDSMPRLYSLCNAALLPSHAEGLPLAVIEAMAARIPVVCSDIEPLREVVNESNALVSRARDLEDLVEKVNSAMTLDDLGRRRLTDAAYETVRAKCDAEKNVRDLETLLLHAVAEGR